MINLNDTTPAAPSGGVNVAWQEDSSGNVSAYIPFGSNTGIQQSPSAGVLTLDTSISNVFRLLINGNVTTMTLTNPTDYQVITILWQMDGTGGYTITPATNLKGVTAPSTGANTFSTQQFVYNAGNSNWYALSAGKTGM